MRTRITRLFLLCDSRYVAVRTRITRLFLLCDSRNVAVRIRITRLFLQCDSRNAAVRIRIDFPEYNTSIAALQYRPVEDPDLELKEPIDAANAE